MSERNEASASPLDRRSLRLLRSLVGLCLVALLAVRWYATHENPIMAIPTPTMPTPNAFDFYVRAGDALTGERQIGEAVNRNFSTRYSLTQKEALVQQNLGAMHTMHRGFAYPYLNPPVRSLDEDTRYYAKFRTLAALLLLQSEVRSAKGDWSGATESSLDAIEMGEEIPHGAPVLGALTGYSVQARGRRSLGNVVAHLNDAQSRTAIARLETILDRHVAFADTIQEEKWLGQSNLNRLFHDAYKPTRETPDDSESGGVIAAANMIYLFRSKKQILHDFTVYMDQSAAQARQPYIAHMPSPPEPTDWINRKFLPLLMDLQWKEAAGKTQNGFLLVALALHAYYLEHGHYPASLAELTPTYLRQLPDDPFAAQGTFPYHVDGQEYLLYSIGPDGKDNGGLPIYDAKMDVGSHPEARYFVRKDSVGDIVAGKNP